MAGWATIFVSAQPNLLESGRNEINEDQWRVALGPGGSLPREHPCRAAGSKSHTPVAPW